jgi:hypothetical protein
LTVGALLTRTVAATFASLPVTTETLVLAVLAATPEAIAIAAVPAFGAVRWFSARARRRHRLRPRGGCRVLFEPAKDPVDDPRPRLGRPFGRARGFRSRGLC